VAGCSDFRMNGEQITPTWTETWC